MNAAEEVSINAFEWFWRKLENRGVPWLILGYLVYQAPTVVDKIAKDKEENLMRLMDIQSRHEQQIERTTQAYQKSISSLVEQWKEDRQMLVDVLKDGTLSDSAKPKQGE
jgi:phosphoribosylformimino-5-aminoimidazole carboxamide ribonucleotide (ProFAR) isomerase